MTRYDDYYRIHADMHGINSEVNLLECSPHERRSYELLAWEIIETSKNVYGDKYPVTVYAIANDGMDIGHLLSQALRNYDTPSLVKRVDIDPRSKNDALLTPIDELKAPEKSYGILCDDATKTGGTGSIAYVELLNELENLDIFAMDIMMDDDKAGISDYSIKEYKRRFFDRNEFLKKYLPDDYRELLNCNVLRPSIRSIGYDKISDDIVKQYKNDNIVLALEESDYSNGRILKEMLKSKKSSGTVKSFRFRNEVRNTSSVYRIFPNYASIKESEKIKDMFNEADAVILFKDKIHESDNDFNLVVNGLRGILDNLDIELDRRYIASRVDQKGLSNFSFISKGSTFSRSVVELASNVSSLIEVPENAEC